MIPGETPDDRREFGRRVKAARGFADISQTQLAERIAAKFPGTTVSLTTIKRLEKGDPSVTGSTQEWAQRVSAVTNMSAEYLWEGDDRTDETRLALRRWDNFTLTDWLYVGARTLWAMRAAEISLDTQQELLRLLRREGGIPFDAEEINQPGYALSTMLEELSADYRWKYGKVSQLLTLFGVPHPASHLVDPSATHKVAPRDHHPTWESLRRFRDGEELSDDELRLVREAIDIEYRMDLDPDPQKDSVSEPQLGSATAPATPRSAADAPPPAPPGETGRRLKEHLPSSRDREPSQTPEEPDAPQANRG